MCVGPILGIVGGVISGIGGAAGAINQANSYEAQAKANIRQANYLREQDSFAGQRATEQARQLVGQQVAGMAENGVDLSGTSGEVVRQSGESLGLDIAAKRYGMQAAIENENTSARINMANAASARVAAPIAFLSPLISAGATAFRSSYQMGGS